MKISKEEGSSLQVTLNIELESADIEPFLERSYKRIVGKVQVPGFRPGKAPRVIVQNYVGKEALVRESLDAILQESLDKAIKEENLEVFGEPDLELLEMDPLSFKAVVPQEPVVDLGDFRSIRMEPEPIDVTEEQVDKVIDQLRYDAAPWEPADRPVKFGDLTTLDVDGVIEGKVVADNKGVDFVPSQDSPMPFPGFSVYLEGMERGASKEFTLSVPEDNPDASIAGKECRFNVKILEIKEKVLPELDDEFAKGVGEGYESLVALRSGVQENVTAQMERTSRRAFEERILEEIIGGASVEVPDITTDREIDHLLEERLQAVQGRRADMEGYLRDAGKTQEELRDEIRPTAREHLTRFLVVRKLAQEEGIEVPSEEIDSEIENLTSMSGESGESMRQALASDSARSSIGNAILSRKVLERLAQIVTGDQQDEDDYQEVSVSADESPSSEEEGAQDSASSSPDKTG